MVAEQKCFEFFFCLKVCGLKERVTKYTDAIQDRVNRGGGSSGGEVI